MFKNFKFKLFVKLFLVYICVFLIPLLVFGSVLTSYTMNNYKQEILDMNIKITDYICNLVDENFQDATIANFQIMENDVINGFISNTDISPSEMAFNSKKVAEEIEKYKTYRSAIASIDIYTSAHDYIITDSGYYTREEYYTKNLSDSGYSYEEWDKIFTNGLDESFLLIPTYNKDTYCHTATIVKPLNMKSNNAYALSFVVINMDYIINTYQSMLSDRYDPYLCMFHNGAIISSEDSIPQSVDTEKLVLSDGYSQSVGGYITSVRKSSAFDLVYVSFLSEDAVLESVNKTHMILILLLISGSLVLILGAVVFSNKTFQPVKSFIASDASSENSFNSIDEIRGFIINTINSNKRLSDVVSKQEKCISDNFYKLFIQNSMSVDENLISAIFSDTSVSPQAKCFRAAIINFGSKSILSENNNGVNVISYFTEVLKNGDIDFYVIPSDGAKMILVLSFTGNDFPKSPFEKLVKLVKNREGIDMSVSIGRSVNSLFKFTKSYEDAFFAQLASAPGVTCYDRGANLSYDSYFTFIKKDKLIFDVSTGNSESVKSFFDELRYIIFVENISTFGIQNYIRYLINGIFEDIVKLSKFSEQQVKKYSATCRNALENQRISESFDSFEKLFMEMTNDIAVGYDPKSPEDIINEIIRYVYDNYSLPDISLKTISEELGATSYKYISDAFKRKTGVKFTDFLHNVRIEKAKELLLETNMRISEIANEVGYLSDNVFIRNFKKSVGITPGEFRQTRQ